MNSFNVYGQTEKKVGGNTPVWLGTVKPIPVGAKSTQLLDKGDCFQAGRAVQYNPDTKEFYALALSDISDANGYIYNDVYADTDEFSATAAIVMHHPEGLLIERVYPEITEEQIQALQAKIPGVLLVRG